MYNFFYCYIYKLTNKGSKNSKTDSINFVAFTVVVHLGLFFACLKRIFDLHYPFFSNVYFYNKLFLAPFAFIWLLLVYLYYKKNSDKILEKLSAKIVVNTKNTILVFSALLIPLIIIILLLKK